MAWQISDYLSPVILNHFFRNTATTPAAALYVALFTDDPARDASGTEVTGGSYARESMAFGAPASDAIVNSAIVTFTTATADWGTISHVALFDAVSSGNLYTFTVLPAAQTLVSGQRFQFDASTLTVSIVDPSA